MKPGDIAIMDTPQFPEWNGGICIVPEWKGTSWIKITWIIPPPNTYWNSPTAGYNEQFSQYLRVLDPEVTSA